VSIKVDGSTRTEAQSIEPLATGEPPPAIATSTLEIDAKPIYDAAGKPITEVNIDTGKIALEHNM
jgi:pre-mRNA 3'-end-processing factor FIP1